MTAVCWERVTHVDFYCLSCVPVSSQPQQQRKPHRLEIDLALPKELCNPTATAVRLLPPEHSNRKIYKHKEQLGQPKHLCSYL